MTRIRRWQVLAGLQQSAPALYQVPQSGLLGDGSMSQQTHWVLAALAAQGQQHSAAAAAALNLPQSNPLAAANGLFGSFAAAAPQLQHVGFAAAVQPPPLSLQMAPQVAAQIASQMSGQLGAQQPPPPQPRPLPVLQQQLPEQPDIQVGHTGNHKHLQPLTTASACLDYALSDSGDEEQQRAALCSRTLLS
jgi:hypothetical protein